MTPGRHRDHLLARVFALRPDERDRVSRRGVFLRLGRVVRPCDAKTTRQPTVSVTERWRHQGTVRAQSAGFGGVYSRMQTPSEPQLLFHPLSPHLLFVASRQSTHLDVWDLRNTSKRSSGGRLARKGGTNQRLGETSSTRRTTGSVIALLIQVSLTTQASISIRAVCGSRREIRFVPQIPRSLIRCLTPHTPRPPLHRMVYSRSLAHSLSQTSSRRSRLSPSRKVCICGALLLRAEFLSFGSGSGYRH